MFPCQVVQKLFFLWTTSFLVILSPFEAFPLFFFAFAHLCFLVVWDSQENKLNCFSGYRPFRCGEGILAWVLLMGLVVPIFGIRR